jgi:hypothetical protein
VRLIVTILSRTHGRIGGLFDRRLIGGFTGTFSDPYSALAAEDFGSLSGVRQDYDSPFLRRCRVGVGRGHVRVEGGGLFPFLLK